MHIHATGRRRHTRTRMHTQAGNKLGQMVVLETAHDLATDMMLADL